MVRGRGVSVKKEELGICMKACGCEIWCEHAVSTNWLIEHVRCGTYTGMLQITVKV